MRKPQADALAFSLLMFSCVMAAWTGIAGPIFADSVCGTIEKWQTLLAAAIALIAAYYAARPVYRQLAEQRRQSAAAASTMIAKSALALEDERAALIKGKDDLENIGSVLSDYDDQSWHDIYMSWPLPRIDAIRELWKTEAADLERELTTEISMIWRRVRQLERIAVGSLPLNGHVGPDP